jgi:hypothetical protein
MLFNHCSSQFSLHLHLHPLRLLLLALQFHPHPLPAPHPLPLLRTVHLKEIKGCLRRRENMIIPIMGNISSSSRSFLWW